MFINISSCSEEQLTSLEKEITKERNKREKVFTNPKLRVYLASSRIRTVFASVYKTNSNEIKNEATSCLVAEIDSTSKEQLVEEVNIKQMRNIEDIPEDWENSIPWNMPDDLQLKLKELLDKSTQGYYQIKGLIK